jgi:hypothetical protein
MAAMADGATAEKDNGNASQNGKARRTKQICQEPQDLAGFDWLPSPQSCDSSQPQKYRNPENYFDRQLQHPATKLRELFCESGQDVFRKAL